MKQVVIASNNAHKVAEIKAILGAFGWEFSTLREAGIASDPAEDADSFEGNARIKAQSAFAIGGGSLAVLADDSGLVVDALGGAPGVYSSRYAGEDGNDALNNSKLLSELADVADEDRSARFVCTLVFIDTDGAEYVSNGAVEGFIGHALKGEGGFGYDPLFYPVELDGDYTFAEVPAERKNELSHRSRALVALREQLIEAGQQ